MFYQHFSTGEERAPAGKRGCFFIFCENKIKAPSFRGIVQLAAPHTWPASVLPVLLGTALALAFGHRLSPVLLALTLFTAVFLQSAVNALNDRRDFISGLDTPENCTDPTDAALVFEGITPRAALCLAVLFMLCAAVCGGLLVLLRGPGMLVYGGIGLLAIILYVMPRLSFSELPLGELLSGLAMGGAIAWAAFHAQTGFFDIRVILLSLPTIISVGCIMLTNNTCDMEKDEENGRKTLSVIIGRRRAQALLRALVVITAALCMVLPPMLFGKNALLSLLVIPAMLFDFNLAELFTGGITPPRRGQSMAGVLAFNKKCIGVYILTLFLSGAAI